MKTTDPRSHKKLQWVLSLSVITLFAFTVFNLVLRESSAQTRIKALKNQAHEIFAFEEAHPGIIANHKLYSLSIALKFHDEKQAESLIQELLPAVR